MIELTQAPGLSAYNRAERKMFHLSKAISGVVLPAETFGTHLKNGETVDEELELINFEGAGEILSEIWNELEIDGYKVKAEYIPLAPTEDITNFSVTAVYKSRHLIQTQYMTVVLKCDDRDCCSPLKTPINMFFPNHRIPPLIPISHTTSGPAALPLEPLVYQKKLKFPDVFQRLLMEKLLTPQELVDKFHGVVPYDIFFPTQQENCVKRVCQVCFKYFSSITSLTEHKRTCEKPKKVALPSITTHMKKRAKVDEGTGIDKVVDENDQDIPIIEVEETVDMFDELDTHAELVDLRPQISIPHEGGVELIVNLKEWLKSPWQLETSS